MTTYNPGDRFNEAKKKGFGAQQTMTIKYQLEGEHERCFVVEQYFPVGRGRGKLLDIRREEANVLIRQLSQVYAWFFRDVLGDGLVRFSYDLGDK